MNGAHVGMKMIHHQDVMTSCNEFTLCKEIHLVHLNHSCSHEFKPSSQTKNEQCLLKGTLLSVAFF